MSCEPFATNKQDVKIENSHLKLKDVLIPIPWMALETVTERRSDKRYSKQSDIWAYGVTIWEIFSKGKEPYEDMDYQDIFCMLNRGERLSQPIFCSTDMY
jgi:serine/threonine protein kinase